MGKQVTFRKDKYALRVNWRYDKFCDYVCLGVVTILLISSGKNQSFLVVPGKGFMIIEGFCLFVLWGGSAFKAYERFQEFKCLS